MILRSEALGAFITEFFNREGAPVTRLLKVLDEVDKLEAAQKARKNAWRAIAAAREGTV